MSQFKIGFGVFQGLLLVLLCVYLVRLRGTAVVLFASGFAATTLELVLLLAFQVLCGSVYHQLGIIVTVFMTGLALGAALANRRGKTWSNGATLVGLRCRAAQTSLQPTTNPTVQQTVRLIHSHEDSTTDNTDDTDDGRDASPRRPGAGRLPDSESGSLPANALSVKSVQSVSSVVQIPFLRRCRASPLPLLAFAIAAYSLLLAFLLPLLTRLGDTAMSLGFIKAAIALLTLILAVLVGMQFPLANRLEFDGTVAGASRLYTADFIGAFLGALLAGALLIPLIGVTAVCLLTAALNLAGGALAFPAKPAPPHSVA